MPDPATRLRRLTKIAESLLELDVSSPTLVEDLAALKKRVIFTLSFRGRRKGNHINLDDARAKAIEKSKAKGDDTAIRVQPIIKRLRKAGYKSYRKIAEALDEMGIIPPKGTHWNPVSVRRIEHRKLS